MHKIILTVIAISASLIATTTPASAKYSLCNKTSYVLSAAIAHVDGDRLATRGWWRLRAGQCKVVLAEETTPGRYFVYAEAIPGHRGPLRTWSGDTPLCVENEGFFQLRSQEVCRNDPSSQRRFFTVDVDAEAKGDYQTDFVEARTYTVLSAKFAGAQRLMRDLGASNGAVDGVLGRQTERDLSAYRKKHGLGSGITIDNKLIDHMVERVNAAEAKLGFFFCNRTNAAVWTAIAEPKAEEYASRGWWLLEEGACTKVIKGELSSDHYYVYGVIETEAGELHLHGGDKSLCVNTVKFDSTNASTCTKQDSDQAIFRRVDVGGAASETFAFEVDMFSPAPTRSDP